MSGDFSGGATITVTKNIIFYTEAGAVIPSVLLNASGKSVEILGFGAVNGFVECRGDGNLICSVNVLGFVTLRDNGSLIVRDCRIESVSTVGVVQVFDTLKTGTFEMRNCRVKCTGLNGPAVKFSWIVGGGSYIIENSILEANGTGASIETQTSGISVDIINVAANTAVNSNTGQNISTILVDSAVRA
jgi:hypothetical protein